MDLSWWHYPLMLLSGFAAGVVNTLAGNGSVFTLSVFLFIGLPIEVANGTNRVGALVQSIAATAVFKSEKAFEIKSSLPIVLPVVLGALGGAFTAVFINPDALRYTIGTLMIVMLLLTVFDPKKYIKGDYTQKPAMRYAGYLAYTLVGFYGGFVQAGVGIFLLITMNLFTRLPLYQANAIKVFSVLAYTVLTFLIFAFSSQVHWVSGIWVSLGQLTGTILAAKFAAKNANAERYIKYLLVAMMLVSIAKLFGRW